MDESTNKAQVKIAKRIFPKFRWYDKEEDRFYFSQDTLFAKKGEGLQILAPYCMVIEKERPLGPEDLQYISEFCGILDSHPEQLPIYSGDLVQIPDNKVFDDTKSLIVQWVPHLARWNISPFLIGRKQIFIVGNIYQPQFEELVRRDVAGFEVATEMPTNGIIKPDKNKLPN